MSMRKPPPVARGGRYLQGGGHATERVFVPGGRLPLPVSVVMNALPGLPLRGLLMPLAVASLRGVKDAWVCGVSGDGCRAVTAGFQAEFGCFG
jgi:hypothetical protein